MIREKLFVSVFAACFLAFISASCSSSDKKSLTRSNAAEIIASTPKFQECFPCSTTVTLGPWNQANTLQPELRWLMEQGYVQLPRESSVISLTDKGKTASKDWLLQNNVWTVPLATKHIVEVTGITSIPPGPDSKEVEFTWSYTLTPIGKEFLNSEYARTYWASYYMGEPHFSKADFSLYDDGTWRIQYLVEWRAHRQ